MANENKTDLSAICAWEERAHETFVADIGTYTALVSKSDDRCWCWSLDRGGDLDPKVDSAIGYFVGDADGAKARAEEMASVLLKHMEAD